MVLLERFVALFLVAFLCAGALIFSVSMTHMHHATEGAPYQICPMVGGTPACANALEHIAHWQTAFVGIFLELFTLLATALVFVRSLQWFSVRTLTGPPRVVKSVSLVPTLFQELFSQGILNPKAP